MAHIRKASYPVCPLCNEVVEIETANTDEKGWAVHEDCYVAHITSQKHGMITMEHAATEPRVPDRTARIRIRA
jgi:hypothetical protein